MTGLFAALRKFASSTKQLNIGAYAASAAFFFFVSLVPILVLICSIFPYTGLSETELIEIVENSTPIIFNDSLDALVDQIYSSSAGVVTVSIIVTIWTAGKGIMALIQGFNRVNEVREERNYFTIRLVSCLYMVVMLFAIFISITAFVLGLDVFTRLLINLRVNVEFLRGILMRPRHLYTFIIFTLVFALMYTWMPYRGPQHRTTQIGVFSDKKLVKVWNETDPYIDENGNSLQTEGLKLRYRTQLPGAMLASLGWMLFSVGFTYIVNYSNTFTVYGTMSFLVIAMLWIYFSMYLLLLGAYFNHVYNRASSSVRRHLFKKK